MKYTQSFFFLLIIVINTVHAQDCYEKIAQQAVQISKLNESSQRTKDSMNSIIQQIQNEKNNLNITINRLKKDSTELVKYRPQIQQIEQYKKERDELKMNAINPASFDSLKKKLEEIQFSLINAKDEIKSLKLSSAKLESEKLFFQNITNKCIGIFVSRYNDTFDNLINYSTLNSLEADRRILQTLNLENEQNQNITKNLNELIIFKKAEYLLNEKFNKSNINSAKNSLQQISKNEPNRLLLALLDEYENININLKNTLVDIQNRNKRKASGIKDLISLKKDETSKIIADFVYFNEVDLTHYKYLNTIITELKSRKMQNVDADVNDLVEKL